MKNCLCHCVEEWAKKTPLEEMGNVLKIVAERLDEHRKGNKGFTPKSIFEPCLGIGLGYGAHEMMIIVMDGPVRTGVMLKLRSKDELSWAGFYQIPGVVEQPLDTEQTVINRLSKEIYGEEGRLRADLSFCGGRFLGIETHYETERKCDCRTALWKMPVSRLDLPSLSGQWSLFTPDRFDSELIVDHHRNTLRSFFNEASGSVFRRF